MKRRTFLAGTAAALLAKGTDGRASTPPASPSTTMRLTIRRADERGHADHGWLDSHHTFSFADYHDPEHMGFRSLRVINEDRVRAGQGFGTHPHRDMEIFSYVLDGALAHKDSMGNGRELRPGEIQLMSAGTGVTHSEFNPSRSDNLHFLQIWIVPRERGLRPGYTEWKPTAATEKRQDVVVISPDGRDGSAVIHQDAIVHRLRLQAGDRIEHTVGEGRGVWVQLIRGTLDANGNTLSPGDGVSTEDSGVLALTAKQAVEALLFDLGPMSSPARR